MKPTLKLPTQNTTLLVILFLLLFIPLIIYVNLNSKQDIYQQAKEATQSAISASTQYWQTIDTGPFSIRLPEGWQYVQKQGVDSFIGEIRGDGVIMTFDYGWYSNPLTEYADSQLYNNTYEVIDGHKALVISSKSNPGIAGVHFEQIDMNQAEPSASNNYLPLNKLTLYAQDLTPGQQQIVLQIFQTIDFPNS